MKNVFKYTLAKTVMFLLLAGTIFPGHGYAATTIYGVPWNADSLGNISLEGENQHSFRFKAKYTGQVDMVRWYNIYSTRAGYNGGDGGDVKIQLQTDDNATHFASGVVLAECLVTNPLTVTKFPLVSFNSPAGITKGNYYHLVFTNPDIDPYTNYVSVNTLWMNTPLSPRQPNVSDLELATLTRVGETGTWSVRENATPIYELIYTDGKRQGQGYMEVWKENDDYDNFHDIEYTGSTNTKVRQNFTPTGASYQVNSMWVRLRKTGTPMPLEAVLTKGSGTVVAEGTTSFTGTGEHRWVQVTLTDPQDGSNPVIIRGGTTYYLTLQASGESSSGSYRAYAIREGVFYQFDNSSMFSDGFAEQFEQGAWHPWNVWGNDSVEGDLQFYFIVREYNEPDPSITVTYPNGGETLWVGSDYDITWDSTGDVGTVRIELLKNAVLYEVIKYNYYNDGRPATWTVPDIPTTKAKINIEENGTGNYADTGNSNFTIKRPSITVTSPNGGETLYVGQTYDITWNSAGPVGTVRIEFYKGSTMKQVVKYNYYNDGRPASWTVPNIPTTAGKIKIKEYNTGNYADTGNSNFTIKNPSITVTSPNGGETLTVGQTYNITWNSDGPVGTVRIELLNGSTVVQVIKYNYYNNGTPAVWTVPNIPTTNAKIRIKEYGTGNYADTSNAVFTIQNQ